MPDFFKIITDGFLNTFYVGKQLAVVDWGGRMPTVDRVYAQAKDIDPEERNQLTQSLSNVAENGNESETIKEVKKLLSFFSKSNYKVAISELSRGDFALYHEMYNQEADSYPFHYYPYAEAFLFTQPFSTIDLKRVEYYKLLIQEGKRPLPIILGGCFLMAKGVYMDRSNWISNHYTGDFIVDGHHKLLAYQELGIKPKYVKINMEGDKADFISEYEMLQSIWDNISIEAKNRIISQKPIIILENKNDFEKDYNQILDNYLSGENPDICSIVLNLLMDAITSNDSKMNDWATQKINTLSKKFPSEESVYLSYSEFNKEGNYLEQISIDCTTKEHFQEWKTKFMAYFNNSGNN